MATATLETLDETRGGGATAPGMPAGFARQVQDALAHLYDTVYLGAHPLAQSLAERGAEQDGAAAARRTPGLLLRRRLESGIASLAPEVAGASIAHATRARGARLLQLLYVECREPEAIQRELGISRAQFYRDRARALEALTALLARECFGVPLPAGDAHAVPARPAIAPDRTLLPPVGAPPAALPLGRTVLLMCLSWGAAWFAAWSFSQTTPWPVAWAIGGVVSGLATAALFSGAAPDRSAARPAVVALGWMGAWTGAWLLGSTTAHLAAWALREDLLAGADPNSVCYAIARVLGWAGGGLVMARALFRSGPAGWPAAAMALGWSAAAAAGHALFWALDPSLHAPGVRFTVSGALEGVVGATAVLWQFGRLRSPARPKAAHVRVWSAFGVEKA